MRGKTDKRTLRRHEDQGGSFWRRSGRLLARRLGFPTTCCLVLNKRWHVVRRHPTPWLKGLLTLSCSQHPISDPPRALLTPSFPFHFATYHPSLAHCCSQHVWPANNGLLTCIAWSPVTDKDVEQKYCKCDSRHVTVLVIRCQNLVLFLGGGDLLQIFCLLRNRQETNHWLCMTAWLCFASDSKAGSRQQTERCL